jgi:thermopsin
MVYKRAGIIALMLILLIVFPQGSIASAQNYRQIIIISPGLYLFSSVNVYTGMNVTFSVYCNTSVNVYIMNGEQLSAFEEGLLLGYVYHANGSIISGNVGPLVKGIYYLIILNNIGNFSAAISYTLSTVPVNVYAMQSSLPAPIGIADYGVQNNSGIIKPYTERFSEIAGEATIYKIKAYNSTPPSGVSQYSASLQLNSVLSVNTSAGTYYYWLQNVIMFNTNNNTMQLLNDLWNLSSKNSVLYSKDISGKGVLKLVGLDNVYIYGSNFRSYSLPMAAYLFTRVSWSPDSVTVSYGYSRNPVSVNWYDNVTIKESGVKSAYIVVNGYSMDPRGTFFDSELVFGGGGNGEYTYFSEMNASLSMWYVLPNGSTEYPRALYGFGSDTMEMADDLTTEYINGVPWVSIGSGNFRPLTMYSAPANFSIKASIKTHSYSYGEPVQINFSETSLNGIAPYTIYITLNGSVAASFTTYQQEFSKKVTFQNLNSGTYLLKVIVIDGINRTAYAGPFTVTVYPTLVERYYPIIYNVTTITVVVLAVLGLYLSFRGKNGVQ